MKKKSFYRYVTQKRKTKEIVQPPLSTTSGRGSSGNGHEEGWGTLEHFSSILTGNCSSLISCVPGSQGRGFLEPRVPDSTQIQGTWLDAFQDPEGLDQCSLKASLHYTWKVSAIRWSHLWLEKGEISQQYLKRIQKKDPGTTDRSVSPLYPEGSQKSSSWKLCQNI